MSPVLLIASFNSAALEVELDLEEKENEQGENCEL